MGKKKDKLRAAKDATLKEKRQAKEGGKRPGPDFHEDLLKEAYDRGMTDGAENVKASFTELAQRVKAARTISSARKILEEAGY